MTSEHCLKLGAVGFVVAIYFPPAYAEGEHLTKVTKAGHDIAILSYARSNQNCEGIEPPGLYLDEPPKHGIVCFRHSKVKLQNAVVGNLTQCLGQSIRGVTIYYFPRSKYVGPDELRYTVIFPEKRHGVYAELTVIRDSADDGSVAASPMEYAQPTGPIPVCSPAVS